MSALPLGKSAPLTERELTILRSAANRTDGKTYLNASDPGAAVHLTELGLGHWEQPSPFVSTFVINDAGRAAAAPTNETEENA